MPNKAQYNEYETVCINGNVTIAPIQHNKYPEIEIKPPKIATTNTSPKLSFVVLKLKLKPSETFLFPKNTMGKPTNPTMYI